MDPDIALFVEVVRAGSLSAAGRRTGVSPAMVSKRIARLEARLGVRLLNRTTRRLDLTALGEQFHADAAAILVALAEAEARLSPAGKRPAGPLRVTAPTSFGRLLIAPLLGPFLDAHPAVDLTLDLSDGFVDLSTERIDLAIRITAAVPPSLTAVRIAASPRVLCAAPAYLARHGTPADVAALRTHRLLATRDQMPWRLTGPGGDVTIDAASHVKTNSNEVIRELTLAGVGVALRSIWDVTEALADGRLHRILPDHRGSSDVAIYAVHPPGRLPPAAAALLDHLTQAWATQQSLSPG